MKTKLGKKVLDYFYMLLMMVGAYMIFSGLALWFSNDAGISLFLLLIGAILMTVATIGSRSLKKPDAKPGIRNVYMKKIGEWFKIIVLPLFLVPLAFMPIDAVTGFFWLIAVVILIKSTATLIKFAFHFLKKKAHFQKEFIQPLLIIVIIVTSAASVVASQQAADQFARRVAHRSQELCLQNNKCPDKISEMQQYSNNVYKTSYGKYGIKYPVTYIISEDKMCFQIRVRHRLDEYFIIKGGVKNKLEEVSKLF